MILKASLIDARNMQYFAIMPFDVKLTFTVQANFNLAPSRMLWASSAR